MATPNPATNKTWYDNALSPRSVCLVWLGMIIGIAVLEPPARFGAAEITYTVALDVGRGIFALLNRVELGLALAVLVLAGFRRAALWVWVVLGAVALILAAQSLWLLPELSQRSVILVGGGEVGPSYAHAAYASTEVAKMLMLLALGLLSD